MREREGEREREEREGRDAGDGKRRLLCVTHTQLSTAHGDAAVDLLSRSRSTQLSPDFFPSFGARGRPTVGQLALMWAPAQRPLYCEDPGACRLPRLASHTVG